MKKERYFIITVDTEGDNLWNYKPGTEVETKNAEFLPAFQEICDKYNFKPVYLANFEMLNSPIFVNFAKTIENQDRCEVGLHLHAWNNPPFYELERKYNGNPYLIEYPFVIMNEKFRVLYELYLKIFGHRPFSHRSGRWAMNKEYFSILEDYGISVDCSYTPGIYWERDCGQTIPNGADYSKEKNGLCWLGNIMEVPMSVKQCRYLTKGSFLHVCKCLLTGQTTWARTSISQVDDIKGLVRNLIRQKGVDYIEFMIHSSELMPNGSPYFVTEESVNNHLKSIDDVFKYMSLQGFKGVTLEEYYHIHR